MSLSVKESRPSTRMATEEIRAVVTSLHVDRYQVGRRFKSWSDIKIELEAQGLSSSADFITAYEIVREMKRIARMTDRALRKAAEQ